MNDNNNNATSNTTVNGGEPSKAVWGLNSAGHFVQLGNVKIKGGQEELKPYTDSSPKSPPPVPPPRNNNPTPPEPIIITPEETQQPKETLSKSGKWLQPTRPRPLGTNSARSEIQQPSTPGETMMSFVKYQGKKKTIPINNNQTVGEVKITAMKAFDLREDALCYDLCLFDKSESFLAKKSSTSSTPELPTELGKTLLQDTERLSELKNFNPEEGLILKKQPKYIRIIDNIEIPQLPYQEGTQAPPKASESSNHHPIETDKIQGEVVILNVEPTIGILVETRQGKVEPIFGHLKITNYKINFSPQQFGTEKDTMPNVGIFPEAYWCDINLPLHSILKIVKRGVKYQHDVEKFYVIQIHTKYFLNLVLAIPSSRMGDRIVHDTIAKHAFVSQLRDIAAFKLKGADQEKFSSTAELIKGEFIRQQAPSSKVKLVKSEGYSYCETYPLTLVVPAQVTDQELRQVAKFRSKGRIPTMTFYRRLSGAFLYRCAQPLVGLSGQRCPADEKFAQLIIEGSQKPTLLVADARPKLNATVNQIMGKGFENSSRYSVSVEFLGIDNIHAMRESLQKLRKGCMNSDITANNDKEWSKLMENSKWVKHLRIVFAGVNMIARSLNEGTSIICHCSDGWDRTSQLCSLAQIVLDPYFRTLKGFKTLIEKDWLAYGHKFHQRIGHGNKKHKDQEMSPIFLQYIDCVWQLQQQFPKAFEFSERILILTMMHLYSCRFGTFLLNADKERKDEKIYQLTDSFWTYLEGEAAQNPSLYYNQQFEITEHVLIPNPEYFLMWKGWYLNWRL